MSLGLHRVVFESDSVIQVNSLNSASHELLEIGVLLREIRSLCICSFESFNFKYCSRSCNNVAHCLAKFGSQAEEECVGWADVAPNFVSDLVANRFCCALWLMEIHFSFFFNCSRSMDP